MNHTAPRPGGIGPVRTDAGGFYPVPSRPLAVVDLDGRSGLCVRVDALRERFGWNTLHVRDSEELGWALTVNRPAAVLVLLSAERPSNIDIVGHARRATHAPIAVLADVGSPHVVGLIAAGADTVIHPSANDEETGARLLSLVRRSADGSGVGARYLVSGPLQVDLWKHETTRDGQPLPLTGTEFRLLVCLMEAGGQVVPTGRIVTRVWGWSGSEEGLNPLRIGIGRLRRKLGDDMRSPRFINSVRGCGYRFGGRVLEVGNSVSEGPWPAEGNGDLLADRLARRCTELADARDASHAAGLIVRALTEEGTADAVGLHLLVGDRLRLVAHRGFSAKWQSTAEELHLAESGYAAVHAVTAAEPVHFRYFSPKSDFTRTAGIARSETPGTYLFVPLCKDGTVVGVMGLQRHTDEPFDPLSITYLKAVASLAGVHLSGQRQLAVG